MTTHDRVLARRSHAEPSGEAQTADDLKSWNFNDQSVDSSVGVLCTLRNINISLFRAGQPGSGDACYLGMAFNLFGGAGRTDPAWPPPPAGLAMSVVLRGANHAFLGEFVLPRLLVSCGESGRLVTNRFDGINPDTFTLAEYPQLWTLESSWLRC